MNLKSPLLTEENNPPLFKYPISNGNSEYYSKADLFEFPLSIKSLNLNSNRIGDFTSSIFKLKNLRHLYLNYTKLELLDDSICILLNLKTLNIGSNHMQSLPHETFKLKNLIKLILNDNKLNKLPGDCICAT